MDPAVMESMTSLGMIQKISTGFVLLDLALCMLLPVALQRLRPTLQKLWARFMAGPDDARFTRHIKFIKREGYYHYDPSERNHILQEAILLYIGSRKDLIEKFAAGDIKVFQNAEPDKGGSSAGGCDSDCGGCSECDSEYDSEDDNDAADLKAMRLNIAPAEQQWIEVEDGVNLQRSETIEERGANGSQRDRTVAFMITSDRADGHARIQAFVDKCFEYYKEIKAAKKDNSRYLFMPFSHAGRGDSGDNDDGDRATNTAVYKRYKLSNEKTFDCYFHEYKEALLYLVDHFLNKSGKFAIQGYPHKLGLLLHGPPGTGKTSLIKALAHYTNRSIVSVPLNKVKKNQELMDIMFDQSFLVHGEKLPIRLPHSKVIFVMEDVDAAGSVVLRREEGESSSHASMMHEALRALHNSSPPNGKSSAPKESGQTSDIALGPHPFELVGKWKDSSDDLNLAGILNVLDGVVDCPGRILIMTSNHPEKLDPALIRPGRIDRRIFLDYMTPRDARKMVAHHFPDASTEELQAFEDALTAHDQLSGTDGADSRNRRVVPAQLESMCAEHEEIGSLTASLRQSHLGPSSLADLPERAAGGKAEEDQEHLAVASAEGPLSPSSLVAGEIERKMADGECMASGDRCSDLGGDAGEPHPAAGVFGSLTVLGPEV